MHRSDRYALPGLWLSGAVLAWFLYRILIGCQATRMINFTSSFAPADAVTGTIFVVVSCVVLWGLCKFASAKDLAKALCPALLLTPLLLAPETLWTIVAVIAVLSICLFRVLILLPFPAFLLYRDKRHYLFFATLVLSGLFAVYYIWVYDAAWRGQHMYFYDWGLFTETAWNTLRGDFMGEYWHNWDGSFLGDHFMPGFFIWFIPLLWLFPYPQTIMVVGALLLAGSGLLIYYFARVRKLPPVFAFSCAAVYLLYPTVTNYNLAVFLGFHAIYLFMPVFILFCCLYERQKWVLMFLVFLFSLTIKETVGAFWIGWGVCQFLTGHKRRGLIYVLISGAYMFLCMKVIIPQFAVENAYLYTERYQALGSTMWEIALSPILRPGEFFSALLHPKKIMLLVLMIVPLLPAVLLKPFWLGSCAFLMTFFLLGQHGFRINLHIQYTVEATILFCLAYVAAISSVYRKDSRWCRKIFCAWLQAPRRRHLAWALAAAGLTAAFLGHFFLAETFFGKYSSSLQRILMLPDKLYLRDKALESLNDNDLLGCNEHAGSLMFCSKIKVVRITKPDCAAYFYDLGDVEVGPGYEFHSRMLNNPDYGLLWFDVGETTINYFFRRGAVSECRYKLKQMPPQEWDAQGHSISLAYFSDLFEVKVLPVPEQHTVRFTVRALKKMDRYYWLTAFAGHNGEEHYNNVLFGYGTMTPADINPGDIFQFDMPLPEHWPGVMQIGCKIEEK